MANFAYIKDDGDIEVYDLLPENWNNISNFNSLDDWSFLNDLGWYKITHIEPEYDAETQYLGDPYFVHEDDKVFQHLRVLDKEIPISNKHLTEWRSSWDDFRPHRDQLISAMDWRVARYNRELRLGLTPTDDIYKIDQYVQRLADLPQLFPDPNTAEWPVFEEGV